MISKQKFYESLIRLTLDHAQFDEDSPWYLLATTINPEDATLEEICIQSDLLGCHIERKADFKTFGEEYLIQCMYFLSSICEYELLSKLFELITRDAVLKNIVTDNFKTCCYNLYVDNILDNHEVACILSEYIIENCVTLDFYNNFKMIAKSLGICSHKISISQLH